MTQYKKMYQLALFGAAMDKVHITSSLPPSLTHSLPPSLPCPSLLPSFPLLSLTQYCYFNCGYC